MERWTMNGNSLDPAGVPPTMGEGAACALTGWRPAAARATTPTAAALSLRAERVLLGGVEVNVDPFVASWAARIMKIEQAL
jgi:hypothetical protein